MIRLSELSREHLSHDAAALRLQLNVPARIRRSLVTQPARWIGGLFVCGLAATLLFRHRIQSPRKEHLMQRVGLSLAVKVVRPIFTSWLTAQLKQFLVSQIRSLPLARPHPGNPGGSKPS